MVDNIMKEEELKVLLERLKNQELTISTLMSERNNFQSLVISANAKINGMEQAICNLCDELRQLTAKVQDASDKVGAQKIEIARLSEIVKANEPKEEPPEAAVPNKPEVNLTVIPKAPKSV